MAAPAQTVGFERWGKRLWYEQDGLRVVLLRTELRNSWPFKLTLAVGHSCLRDFDGRQPAPRSASPSEYPIKIKPSQTAYLTDKYRYVPLNLGRWPSDVMSDDTAEAQLQQIGAALAEHVPSLSRELTPQRMVASIKRYGQNAWCEQRWIDDYTTELINEIPRNSRR
ncbi:hypothetical protein [Microbacterium maritypicum]|uniref:hypothetical protein n=1 Tax=Microbacterium maritypicum TaxID=33918 RepID=UPI003A931494